MIPRISEKLLDQVEIRWGGDSSAFLVAINFPELTDPLQIIVANFLYISQGRDLRYIAEYVAKRASFSLDMRGFLYPNPTSPHPTEYTDFEGVVMTDGNDHAVNLSESAFTSLISRLLSVVITGATRTGHAITRETWWPDLLKNAETIAHLTQTTKL